MSWRWFDEVIQPRLYLDIIANVWFFCLSVLIFWDWEHRNPLYYHFIWRYLSYWEVADLGIFIFMQIFWNSEKKKKKYPFQTRRATSGVEGGRSPLPFFRNKCVQIFGKSVPFLCIYELHSHLKFDLKCILRVSQRKKQNFPCGAFLLYVIHEMFIEVPLFPRILLCLKKFLVAHQQTEV